MREDPPDPFEQLSGWAARTERKVKAGRRLRWIRFLPAGAVGLAAVAVLVFVIRSVSTGGDAGPADDIEAAPPAISVTTSPEAAARTDAFAGTAAAGYPKGAAGITLPPARAVPGFSADQVQAALGHVRAAMIAGRLDEDMLVGHKTGRFVAMFAANQRQMLEKDFAGDGFDTYATWIDPAVKLDAREEPRVSGRVTYTSVKEDGIQTLRVTTNFVWVYAFDRADKPLAVVHDEIRWRFPSTADLRAGDQGMWFGPVRAYNALIDCAAIKRGLLAPTPPGAGAAGPIQDEDALLRADHALEIKENC
ncbi:hypothetical protein GCM10010172_76030 [Paractinoplanes ferrugineus]|uniref:Uncharacterized protein n=1 Tax=Paractinoplanes ferrugineus TaxID=113564 RepID=A0A919J0P9_9ACTN|nr:hypothetical protein [Actinoplanes ferrugineus]GIE11242.1 hypothetical protein Afe05nite_30820 [Actinoplanes ferrugineus]